MSKSLQNFYIAKLSLDWSIGTGIFYVTVKPTITDGWLVISPNNTNLAEIVKYTSTGSDTNGDYVVVSQRGVGGTTEQTHTIGEPIRMNITAEYWQDMNDAIDSIVAAGAPNAATDTKGIVEIATDAEVIAGTNTGSTGAVLVPTPGQMKTNYEKIVPIVRTYLTGASPATWTKPAGLKYVEVEVQGGGGGGQSGSSSASRSSGGSGGGGGYSKKTITASSLGVTETVTIGVGGTAGTGASGSGGNGGTSSFGSHVTCNGGTGATEGSGSSGGSSSGGDINITGQSSSQNPSGFFNSTSSSANASPCGGNSILGLGGSSPWINGVGGSGTGFGSGGAGGSFQYNSGGAGAAGIVIVKEYF